MYVTREPSLRLWWPWVVEGRETMVPSASTPGMWGRDVG